MADAAASRLDDYMDVFIAPTELFRRRSDGKFVQAMVVFVVVATILYFATRTAMAPIMEAEIKRGIAAAMRQNPSMTEEQVQTMRQAMDRFRDIGALGFVLVGTPVMMLLLGGAVWVAARVVGAGISYVQGATIATFAMFPKLFDSISGALQALFLDETVLKGRFSVSLGAGRFFDPDTANQVLLQTVGRIDVFTIWTTVLVAIGIKVMGKASTGQAAGAAILVWIVGGLPAILQALRAG
jgi:hypothetical protein